MTDIKARFRIRAVTPQDAPLWLDLRDALWPEERARHAEDIAAFFNGTLHEPLAVLLAETQDAQAVGHVELSLRTDIPGLLNRPTGYIEGLYVVPRHRSQGVANSLINASQHWARHLGARAFATDRNDRLIIHRAFSASTVP